MVEIITWDDVVRKPGRPPLDYIDNISGQFSRDPYSFSTSNGNLLFLERCGRGFIIEDDKFVEVSGVVVVGFYHSPFDIRLIPGRAQEEIETLVRDFYKGKGEPNPMFVRFLK